jgi:hypothetical protein
MGCSTSEWPVGDSLEQIFTCTNSTLSIVVSTFAGNTDYSGGGVSAGAIDTTYVLGNIVTVNGSFIGIINSKQINMTNTVNTNGKNFDLVAINGDKIIFGDAEGALDASNEAKRPTQLFGQTFTKQ